MISRNSRPAGAHAVRFGSGKVPMGSASPGRTESSSEGSLLARGDADTNTAASAQDPSDGDGDATSGMTQMASGEAAVAPASSDSDDLAELRRRLTDRPLQVPELGALKPTGTPRPGQNGWIRF